MAASSVWSKRLTTKLSGLGEKSSNESIKTLVKWIGFNRKHAAAFADVLQKSIVNCSSPSRQVVLLSVVNSVLIAERGTAKWEKFADLRVAIGENMTTVVKSLGSAALTKLKDEYLKEWDEANVFSGPTLIGQIKRALTTSVSSSSSSSPTEKPTTTTTTTSSSSTTTPTSSTDTAKPEKEPATTTTKVAAETPAATKDPPTTTPSEKKNDDDDPPPPSPAATSPPPPPESKPTTPSPNNNKEPILKKTPSSTSSKAAAAAAAIMDVEFDFSQYDESIPEKHVEPKSFLTCSREVAKLQIARDLRNDTAVQLSALFQGLPQDIRQACAKRAAVAAAAADGDEISAQDDIDITELQARDFSKRTSSTLLDMDMREQLQNISSFREIVQRQRQARNVLVKLLIESRCQFGAHDAAAAMEHACLLKTSLQARKEEMVDAMELEGHDVEELDKDSSKRTTSEQQEQLLAPLTWYKPVLSPKEEHSNNNKRQRVD